MAQVKYRQFGVNDWMNSKLYKKVHDLAETLLSAVENDNEEQFALQYEELKNICYENEGDDHKNHPVQWETLADFTEEVDEALRLYKKAFEVAEGILAMDYMASITYAMALLLSEAEQEQEALSFIRLADEYAKNISDSELQREINALLQVLMSAQ